jgi:hypothetical protein
LAVDGVLLQNPADPEDADRDGEVSPIDVLAVVNQLNAPDRPSDPRVSIDVDGDGVIAPIDALMIINRLNNKARFSAVAPQARAANLRNAIDSGRLPPHLTREEALDMFETLSRGGRWEIGERYRNGRMVSEQDPAEESVAGAPAEGDVTDSSVNPPSEDVVSPTTDESDAKTQEAMDLQDLFDHLDEDSVFDEEWWLKTLHEHDPTVSADEFSDQVRAWLAESLRDVADHGQLPEWLNESHARDIVDKLENSATPLEDVMLELQQAQAYLGNIHDQVVQIFARMDIDAILEQVRVDLATLIEAHLGEQGQSEHDAIFTEFLRTAPLSMF